MHRCVVTYISVGLSPIFESTLCPILLESTLRTLTESFYLSTLYNRENVGVVFSQNSTFPRQYSFRLLLSVTAHCKTTVSLGVSCQDGVGGEDDNTSPPRGPPPPSVAAVFDVPPAHSRPVRELITWRSRFRSETDVTLRLRHYTSLVYPYTLDSLSLSLSLWGFSRSCHA